MRRHCGWIVCALSAGLLAAILVLMPRADAEEPYQLDDPAIQQLIRDGRLQPRVPIPAPTYHGETSHEMVTRWVHAYCGEWPECWGLPVEPQPEPDHSTFSTSHQGASP